MSRIRWGAKPPNDESAFERFTKTIDITDLLTVNDTSFEIQCARSVRFDFSF